MADDDVEDLCVLCGGALDGSDEHIFVSALGGRRSSVRLTCSRCNNGTGNTIDAALSKAFAFIANGLDIETGRGQTAATLKDLKDSSGKTIDLGPGWKPQLRTQVSFADSGDGPKSVSLVVDASRAESAATIRHGFARKHKVDPSTLRTESTGVHHEYLDGIHVRVEIGPESLRAIAKSALLLLAHGLGTRALLTPQFAGIIEYIRHGGGIDSFVTHDYTTKFPSVPALALAAPWAHTVVVTANPATGLVLGFVEVFGTFRFSVRLADTWSDAPFTIGYSVDPTTREQRDATGFEPSDVTAAELDAVPADYRPTLKARFEKLLQRIFEHQEKQVSHDALEKILKKRAAGRPPDATVTQEDIAVISREFAEWFVRHEMRIGSRSPLPPEIQQLIASPPQPGRKSGRGKRKKVRRK